MILDFLKSDYIGIFFDIIAVLYVFGIGFITGTLYYHLTGKHSNYIILDKSKYDYHLKE